MGWYLNGILSDGERSIRELRRTGVPYPLHDVEDNKRTVNCNNATGSFSFHCPVCSHKEPIRRSLFVSDHITMKIFIGQSMFWNRCSLTSKPIFQNIGKKILIYVRKSEKLVSKFNTVSPHTFNGKTLDSRNFMFSFLDDSAILALREKEQSVHGDIASITNVRSLF